VTTPPTDAYRKNAASPNAWLESMSWDEEGTKLAFLTIFDGHPAEMIYCVKNTDNWTVEKYRRGQTMQLRGYGGPIKWYLSGFSFLTDDEGKSLPELESSGPMSTPLTPPDWIKRGATVYSFHDNAYYAGFADAPADIHVIGDGLVAKKITDIN